MASITKRGDGQWQVKIRRKGWPAQSATFATKKRAQDWAHRTESEMAAGHFVDHSAGQRTTLGELVSLYLKDVTEKRPGEQSRIAERSRLERFLREEAALCAHAVANLTPEQFEAYRDRRLAQTNRMGKLIAPGTVKRELTLLKRVIDYRKRRLGLLVNPVNTEDVPRPVVNDERDVRLTAEEIAKLLDACGDARNPWLRPLVELGFETGGRRGSLLGLLWQDVDLPGRAVTFRGVKNSRNPEKVIDHSVPLSPRAIEILQQLPRSVDGRVFPLTPNAFRQAFGRARKKAGLEHFRFHDTRHERVSSLFEAGWSDTAVMAMSGHRDPKSLKRYANLRPDHLADELAKLGKGKKK
ncbi:integrase [Defluviimonas sp. 20V17]|uniref:Integrase n=1 Tax=Allgaiera indica TaxID=765699 RepID=A0AAN4ZY91_9RHOB|nr:site-specific integrase [Allgaiera indica]KDB04516.1 integrase [Defluviimonas sp. 20V17]GHD99772.1 integrase [Allgaiera indica]SDW18758.1 Site-specific recombinase XerC [Allgaiera indica]